MGVFGGRGELSSFNCGSGLGFGAPGEVIVVVCFALVFDSAGVCGDGAPGAGVAGAAGGSVCAVDAGAVPSASIARHAALVRTAGSVVLRETRMKCGVVCGFMVELLGVQRVAVGSTH